MPAISDEEALPLAIARFGHVAQPGSPVAEPLGTGLINRTYRVRTTRGDFVLQRVNPIFDPLIHDNIRAVTACLAEHGIPTPRLVEAIDGRPCVDLGAGGLWRMMTLLAGASFDTVRDPAQARAAASLLARFHDALAGIEHRFVGLRSGVHEAPRHLLALREALARNPGHRLLPEAQPLARGILAAAMELAPLPDLPPTICHGDLKFSNVIFAGRHGPAACEALGLVDLDTVGPMSLACELGDAWRSWCNPHGEEREDAVFDLEVFGLSLDGYRGARLRPLEAAERRALLGGVEWISLELAARFCADALDERYFGWDPKRFAGRGEHNLLRARSQWALHRAVVATREARARLLDLEPG